GHGVPDSTVLHETRAAFRRDLCGASAIRRRTHDRDLGVRVLRAYGPDDRREPFVRPGVMRAPRRNVHEHLLSHRRAIVRVAAPDAITTLEFFGGEANPRAQVDRRWLKSERR